MNQILLKRPGVEVGDRREYKSGFEVPPFDLYGRHHEVLAAEAVVAVTKLAEGLHLDLEIRATVLTNCDRTLEPTELVLQFGDSEFLSGPKNQELCIADWTLDPACYAGRALKNEVPMQVFAPETEPVVPEPEEDRIDPRWKGLDDLFASGF